MWVRVEMGQGAWPISRQPVPDSHHHSEFAQHWQYKGKEKKWPMQKLALGYRLDWIALWFTNKLVLIPRQPLWTRVHFHHAKWVFMTQAFSIEVIPCPFNCTRFSHCGSNDTTHLYMQEDKHQSGYKHPPTPGFTGVNTAQHKWLRPKIFVRSTCSTHMDVRAHNVHRLCIFLSTSLQPTSFSSQEEQSTNWDSKRSLPSWLGTLIRTRKSNG